MFWGMMGSLAVLLFLGLCYVRRQIQGYWYDRRFRPNPKPDLLGKTVLITGGNSGIGLEAAVGFAKYGADVFIACRSPQKAEKAVQYIKKRSGTSSQVSALSLDLSSLQSVRACAEAFLAMERPLHYLVNNAGIAPPAQRVVTEDGHELTFQANYLGHFLFTRLLMPAMERSAKESEASASFIHRIIATSSGAHNNAEIFWDDVSLEAERSYGMSAYGQSKLAQILHCKQLQADFDAENLPMLAVACTPGFARTGIFGGALAGKWWGKPALLLLHPLILFLSRSSARGAETVLLCALGEDIQGGGYYSNCLKKPSKGKNGMANDPEAAKRLWALSEKLLEK